MRKLIGLCALFMLAMPVFADGTLDGVIGAGYGAAVSTDPAQGTVGGATCNITNLYVAESGSDVYIAINVEDNIATNSWGKYCFFIETDNATNRATTGNGNGWNRPIQPDGTNCRPTYWIGSWVDSGGGAELYAWNGTTWGSNLGGVTIATAAGSPSVVEYKIPKASIGTPNKVRVWAISTGGGGGDSAIDTVPNGNEASDWGVAATINTVQSEVQVPVELSSFGIE